MKELNEEAESRNVLGGIDKYVGFSEQRTDGLLKPESQRNQSNGNTSCCVYGHTEDKIHYLTPETCLNAATEEPVCNSMTARHCRKLKTNCHVFFLEP